MTVSTYISIFLSAAHALGAAAFQGVVSGSIGDVQFEPEFEEQLWEGTDFADAEAVERNVGPLAHALNFDKKPSPLCALVNKMANVQVMGLQDTGTNLLVAMLQINFPNCMINYYDSTHKEGPGSGSNKKHGLWKHSNLLAKHRAEPEAIEELNAQGVVPLMMIRNPMSWFHSIKKAPYELFRCVEGDNWLDQPCPHRVPGGYGSKVPPTNYTNIERVWGQWVSPCVHYEEMGFSRGMVIRYEDLVLKPLHVMDRIAKYLNLPKPAEGWELMTKSAKNHGESHGRGVAMERIRSRAYMHDYASDADVLQACRSVNHQLALELKYHDCDEVLDQFHSVQRVMRDNAELWSSDE